LFGGDFDASVTRLIEAIKTDLDWVREHTEWGLKAREWDRGDRDPSFLLSGRELGVDVRVGDERVVVAIALAVLALVQRHQAVSEKQSATSGELAAQSLLQLGTDPQLSLLLADQSARAKETPAALDALRRSLPANHLLKTFHSNDRPLIAAGFSPDGSQVLTAGLDGYARVWSVATGEVQRTFPTSNYYYYYYYYYTQGRCSTPTAPTCSPGIQRPCICGRCPAQRGR
jgi:hypothetical protein